MTRSLLLAVSPYHLTTRDPAALAACLLADRLVTLLPVPPGDLDRDTVRAAFRASPPYARLLESWRWVAPLFESGIACSSLGTDDATSDALATRARLDTEPAWHRLRGLMHAEPLVGPVESLDRLASDLLKGGPDPGLSLPIVAGLDAFAVSHHAIVVRAGGDAEAPSRRAASAAWRGSAAQRLEAAIAQRLFTIGIPFFRQADGQTLLWARDTLHPTLTALRTALRDALAPAPSPAPPASTSAALSAASRDFARAFAAALAARGPGRDGPQGEQVLDGFVRLTGVRLPADAALRAGEAAAGRLAASGASQRAPSRPTASGSPPVPRTLAALVIEPLAIRPRE